MLNRKLLKEIRLQRGKTQEEMAAAIGYKSKSAYCSIETGVNGVSTETAAKIATVLDMSDSEKVLVFLTN